MPAHLKYLLVKNWLTLKRCWRWIITEQILVIVIFITVIINPIDRSRSQHLKSDNIKHIQFFKNATSLYDLTAFEDLWTTQGKSFRFGLLYTPANNFTTPILNSLKETFNFHYVKGVTSEEMIFNYFVEKNTFAGIVFHNVSNGEVPRKLAITLRFPSEFRTIENDVAEERFWITRCSGMLSERDTTQLPHIDLYLREGFLQIQHHIFRAWLRLLNVASDLRRLKRGADDGVPRILVNSLSRFRENEPCYMIGSANFNWFLYNFTFLLTFLHIVKLYAREREDNIQAHHWIYGYEQDHHRISKFLMAFPRLLILDTLIVIMLTITSTSEQNPHIQPGILMLMLVLYSITLIIYAMIVSTLFINSKNCVLFAAVIWLGNYGLFSVILDYEHEFTGSVIFSLIYFFNNTFPFGMRLMNNDGIEQDFTKISKLIYTQIAAVFVLMFILSLLEYVHPGRYIKRNNFNFMGMPYLCHREKKINIIRSSRKPRNSMYTLEREAPSWRHYEYGPANCREILYVKNLITYLDRKQLKHQLNNINMRFFRNEISVILGAHSSGKTSLLCFLAGWQKPPVGFVYYDGDVDIYENWSYYRQFVDVSMPNNPIFDLLTVNETLEYFYKVKIPQLNEQDQFVELSKWRNVLRPVIKNGSFLVGDLNFSQKRILSLCCTLLGNRPIILLDEPTLHMTAAEQRIYWQILQKEKVNRAIIVSTFSIDEADVIGDRIGILSDGFLVAYGSSFFLRTHFGHGFDLIILKDPVKSSKPIGQLIANYFPQAVPINPTEDQLIYKLPGEKRMFYQRLLLELEKESGNLGITHICIRGSELNEIYMRLGLNQVPKLNQTLPQISPSLKVCESVKQRKLLHIRAMLYKKMLYQAPNVIPLVMIFAVFLLILLINEMTERFDVPLQSVNTDIYLGFRMENTVRSMLADYTTCKYVEINDLVNVKYITKINNKPRSYVLKELNCGQESYERDMRLYDGINHKFGAVERKEDGNLAIWINERIFHTAGVVLNLAHNMILQDLYPDKSEILTTIVNKPIDIPLHTNINIIENQISHMRVPLTMGIIMPLTMSCFIVNLVEERHSHLFTLQRIAGIRMDIYWIVGILWDYGIFVTYTIVYILIMSLTTIEGFGAKAKLLTFLLINVYGISSLALIYLISLFMGANKTEAFLKATLWQFVLGLCLYIFYWEVLNANKFLYYLLHISPIFSLLEGISNIYTNTKEREYCEKRCLNVEGCTKDNLCGLVPICCLDTFFKWSSPGILPSLTFMLLTSALFGVIFFLVNLVRQEMRFNFSTRIKQLRSICFPQDDPDVVKEKLFISSMSMSACKKYNVLVDQVEKQIPKRGHQLQTVSFALKSHTSLAIYGSRHSGKTHLIQQLVGDHSYHFGEIYICEMDCRYQTNKPYTYVGYCPQAFGLYHGFTPRQLFTLFLMLRGVPERLVAERIREICHSLDLLKCMSIKIGSLPETIKRRLNIGLALIVNNKVLILDEPTRGLQALERRIIWNVLRSARNNGASIIYSSSESLDCEALSDYMIVMDDGEMLAIGSIEHVKKKYTKGLYLEVKLLADGSTAEEANNNLYMDIENMIRYVHFLHEDSILIYHMDYYLKFYIPAENLKYSFLFGSLEKSRSRLNISQYTLRQPNLLEALEHITATRLSRQQFRLSRIKSFELLKDVADLKKTKANQLKRRETVEEMMKLGNEFNEHDLEREDGIKDRTGEQDSSSRSENSSI